MSLLDPASLDAQIMAAHEGENPFTLAELYALASEQKRACGDAQAAGFLLTQAYVYALDSGHPTATQLRQQLIAEGREPEE